jgi:hypothetical protein
MQGICPDFTQWPDRICCNWYKLTRQYCGPIPDQNIEKNNAAGHLPNISGYQFRQHENVVILGAGPSLNETYLKLRHFPPDTAVIGLSSVLLKNHKLPRSVEYWVCVDFSEAVLRYVIKPELHGITAFLCNTVTPRLFDFPWKEVICFDEAQVLPGHGVTYTALQLAWRMRPKRVFLMGQDCGYYDKVTERFGIDQNPVAQPPYQIMGNGIRGKLVATDFVYLTIARSIEMGAYWLALNGVEVYNCSEFGLVKLNVTCAPVDEIFKERAEGVADA